MDTGLTASDIASRLERLEASNRRLRVALGGAVIGGVALVLAAAARGGPGAVVDEVVARRLRIVDESGATVVNVSAVKGGSRLEMTGGVDASGSLIATCDASGALLTLDVSTSGQCDWTTSKATMSASEGQAACFVSREVALGARSEAGLAASTGGSDLNLSAGGVPLGAQDGAVRLECGGPFGSAATFSAPGGGGPRVKIRSSSMVRGASGAVESRPTPFIVLTGGDGATAELRPVDGSGK